MAAIGGLRLGFRVYYFSDPLLFGVYHEQYSVQRFDQSFDNQHTVTGNVALKRMFLFQNQRIM